MAPIFDDLTQDVAFFNALERTAKFEIRSATTEELKLIYMGCWIEYKNPSNPKFSSLEPDGWRRASEQVTEVEQSLQGLHYHVANIMRMERRLDALIKRYQGRALCVQDDSTRFWWGLTNKVTFEFQAYASLFHRHLAYIARLLGSLLGVTCPNLLSVQKYLSNRRSSSGNDLLRVLQSHQGWVEQLYSRKMPKVICLRDELAHESFVPAGGFHIRGMRAHVFGRVASGLNRSEPEFRIYRLGDEMQRQMQKLDRLVADVLRIVDRQLVPRPDERVHMRKNGGSESGDFGTIPMTR